jgi:hypothetical protein
VQAWLREPEWLRVAESVPDLTRGSPEAALRLGAVAVGFCVSRAYQLPADPRYVLPLSQALFGVSAPLTLWLLDGYDELDAAGGMASDLRATAMAAVSVRKQQRQQAAGNAAASASDSMLGSATDGQRSPSEAAIEHHVASAATVAAPSSSASATLAALRLLVSQSHVTITTRPAFAVALGCTSYVRLEPLARAEVASFCEKALGGSNSSTWARLRSRMAASDALADAMRTPVIMQVQRAIVHVSFEF